MTQETWKSSYAFDFRLAAQIMEEALRDVGLPSAHSKDDDADYFDVEGGSFTIKLYHNRFRTRVGFGFPGWLKPGDISDITISPLDTSKELKIQAVLGKFVEKAPVKPWEFGAKVKAYRIGIASSVRKSWERWIGVQ